MLIFVRHGKTDANNPEHETLRGWLPIPLTLEGMKESIEVGEELEDVENVESLKCGTLVRVVQSATEIANVLSMELEPMEELNDWNTGDFAGQAVKKTLNDLHDHIKYPLKKVPGGETFQFFLDRIIPVLTECVENDKVDIVVSSGRISTLLKALSKSKGKEPDTSILLGKPPIDPSGVLIMDSNWRITFMTKKSEQSKGLS
jgi:broad specificity phosphatase PhoE